MHTLTGRQRQAELCNSRQHGLHSRFQASYPRLNSKSPSHKGKKREREKGRKEEGKTQTDRKTETKNKRQMDRQTDGWTVVEVFGRRCFINGCSEEKG